MAKATIWVALVMPVAAAAAFPVAAMQEAPPVAQLFSGGATILGEQVEYPAGDAEVTSVLVTMKPGDSNGWHRHDVPTFGYVLKGELTVDYGDKGVRTFPAGSALLEAFRTAHQGSNRGAEDVELIVVYMGAEGIPNSVALEP